VSWAASNYVGGSQGGPGGVTSTATTTAGASYTCGTFCTVLPGGPSAWGAGGNGIYSYGGWPAYLGGGGGGYKGSASQGGGGSSYAATGGTTEAGTIYSAWVAGYNGRHVNITFSPGGAGQAGYAAPAGYPSKAGRVVLTWQ